MKKAAKVIEEQVLLLRCQMGDMDAFAELIERYERPLHYFINRLLDNRELTEEIGEAPPEVWEIALSEEGAPVILEALRRGDEITLDTLTTNPFNRETHLGCRALLLAREDERIALPSRDESLKVGDRVLFCGMPGNEDAMGSLLHDRAALDYLIGEPSPRVPGAGRKPAH